MKKKIKTFLLGIARRSVFLRKIMKNLLYAVRRTKFSFMDAFSSVDEKTVVFNTFTGRGFGCSPKAIYLYLLTEPDYSDYKFIWAVAKDKEDELGFLADYPNTSIVTAKSREYARALCKAKYWITNYRENLAYWPGKKHIYVQCWHGTPLKRLGCDLESSDNAMNTLEELKHRYIVDGEKFDYLLSPSRFATEKFITAWDLKRGGRESCLIEEGYPRNDILLNYKEDYPQKIRKKLGLPDDKKILLYAPTWRDNQYDTGVGYTYELPLNFDILKEETGDQFIVLFRAHYLVASNFDFEKYKGFVYDVSSYMDINDLYIVSDVLATDYSSVFFDYANLKRPMIFYMYDKEEYGGEIRGFYLSLEELPGPIVESEADFIGAVKQSVHSTYDDKYERFNNKFNYLDDGRATERVVKRVFE